MKKILNKIIDFKLLFRVLRLVGPHKGKFYLALFLTILISGLTILNPYIVQITIDKYVLGGNGIMLRNMILLMLALMFVQAYLTYNFTYTASWLGQSIIKTLRARVFNHILHLRVSYFDKTPVGISTTRTINDIEAINDIFSEGIINILSDMLTIITVLACMFYFSWRLTMVSMSVLPLLLLAAYIFKEGIRKSFTDVRNQVARLNSFLQEHITGMSVVQIFNAEEQEMDKFRTINAAHRDANVRSNFYYSVFFPVVELISAMALGLLVWYWAHLSLADVPKPGLLTAFIMYINLLFRPIRTLADKFNTLQMGMVAAERVFKIIDSDDRLQHSGTIEAKNIKGNIQFDKVWFAYNEDKFVLKDVSFEVKQGETLAIVGATGAGKSSIINLLNRFYEIQQGAISIDGVNIKDYEVHSLRKNIGLVLQDVFLFSGSVLENITLRNDQISRAEVIRAAELCGIQHFIERLPGQYDYEVKERGATLSQGQRQLISFVRALVFDPKILILDEATSSIDTESEKLIQSAIDKMIVNRTSIVIAHRLSTIQKANKIMVLDHGELKEIGTHTELLALNGYYARLYEMQFKKTMVAP
jgi:ATP-binding cassette subfamily B multidrug efflux pump